MSSFLSLGGRMSMPRQRDWKAKFRNQQCSSWEAMHFFFIHGGSTLTCKLMWSFSTIWLRMSWLFGGTCSNLYLGCWGKSSSSSSGSWPDSAESKSLKPKGNFLSTALINCWTWLSFTVAAVVVFIVSAVELLSADAAAWIAACSNHLMAAWGLLFRWENLNERGVYIVRSYEYFQPPAWRRMERSVGETTRTICIWKQKRTGWLIRTFLGRKYLWHPILPMFALLICCPA